MPTKKVGPAGKFGSRYGRKIRTRVINVMKARKGKYVCTQCLHPGVKRVASGIWVCNKCGLKFAGKAYKPF